MQIYLLLNTLIKLQKWSILLFAEILTSLVGRGKCQPRCYPRFLPRFFMKYDPLLKILLSQPRRDFYLHTSGGPGAKVP